jgi:hypothetical protein
MTTVPAIAKRCRRNRHHISCHCEATNALSSETSGIIPPEAAGFVGSSVIAIRHTPTTVQHKGSMLGASARIH